MHLIFRSALAMVCLLYLVGDISLCIMLASSVFVPRPVQFTPFVKGAHTSFSVHARARDETPLSKGSKLEESGVCNATALAH